MASLRLAIFISVPQAQDENPLLCEFIAHFVLAYDQSSHFARREFFESFAAARMFAQLFGRCGERAHDLGGGLSVDVSQECMQPRDVPKRSASPLYPHDGTGSGLPVSRLSTQFSTASWSTVLPESTSASASSVSR